MTKSKLIQLLRTFSKEEFKNFGVFVRSPFFYKDKAVIKLYNSLKVFYPEFTGEKLCKEFLFKDMYPSKKYSDSHMKYLMSELYSMGKEFLININYSKDVIGREMRLLNELNSRNTSGLFISQLVKLESRIDEYGIRNEEYFHDIYKLKKLVSDFYSYKDRLSSKREPGKIIENTINAFLLSMLDTYYELSIDAAKFRSDTELTFLNFVEELISKNDPVIDPAVLIYYNILMLSNSNEDTYYLKLLDLKSKYLYKLDDNGKHRIFEALGNYCIKQFQQGKIRYYRDAFNLFNDEIKHGVRFSRKEFSEIFFTNKVEIASSLKEFKWANDFINTYKDRLNINRREDIVNFCWGILEFEKKNYTISLEKLSRVNLNNTPIRYRIRNFTLLNYYELSYTEQAISMLDAYRHMLVKDNIIEKDRKKRYNDFLLLYQKLLDVKTGVKSTGKDFLKHEIESNAVFMKDWLLKKAGEL